MVMIIGKGKKNKKVMVNLLKVIIFKERRGGHEK